MISSLKQREIKFKPRILEPQHIQIASAPVDEYGDPQILFQNLSLSMQVLFQESNVKLSANGSNNSQHLFAQQCWELLRPYARGAFN